MSDSWSKSKKRVTESLTRCDFQTVLSPHLVYRLDYKVYTSSTFSNTRSISLRVTVCFMMLLIRRQLEYVTLRSRPETKRVDSQFSRWASDMWYSEVEVVNSARLNQIYIKAVTRLTHSLMAYCFISALSESSQTTSLSHCRPLKMQQIHRKSSDRAENLVGKSVGPSVLELNLWNALLLSNTTVSSNREWTNANASNIYLAVQQHLSWWFFWHIWK